MRVDVKIDGVDDAVRMLLRTDPALHRELAGAITEAAYLVEAKAKSLVLEPPKTGRLYKLSKTVVHQASAPGEAPASREAGNLVNSIQQDVDAAALECRVAAKTPYAEALEYGTTKMEPRPFMRRALDESERDVVDAVRDAVKRVKP